MGTPGEEVLENWTKSWKESNKPIPQFAQTQAQHLRNFISEEQIDDSGLELLYMMLEYDPKKRITAKSALKHPYFNQGHANMDAYQKQAV